MFINCGLLNAKRFYSTIKPLRISNILQNKRAEGSQKIQGWVKSVRKMKDTVFIDVTDGSCNDVLQVTFHKQKPTNLSTGASVVATGVLNVTPKGQLELVADELHVCGACMANEGYPLSSKQKYSGDYLRQHLHFRPRTGTFASLLRVRDCATLELQNYLRNEGFIRIHTPILTSNDCEGAGETFTVIPDNKQTLNKMSKQNVAPDSIYFNSKVFLTVSGQLQLEAVAHGLSRVYTLGPVFRAENSKSRLHLSEFYMLELECAFVESIDVLMEIIETFLKEVTGRVLDACGDDIKMCKESEVNYSWLNSRFSVLEYDEAATIIADNFGSFDLRNGFGKEHELFLVKHCNEVPVFIINWPKLLKPFYMKSSHDDKKVAALDLLVPNVGELVGGSLREDNYELLKKKLPPGNKELNWYLDIRKFGGVPTAGFGLGFERYLQFILGIGNIKDTIPFPRWPHNCLL